MNTFIAAGVKNRSIVLLYFTFQREKEEALSCTKQYPF